MSVHNNIENKFLHFFFYSSLFIVSEHSRLTAMSFNSSTTSDSISLFSALGMIQKSNVVSFNHQLFINLDDKNYLFWEYQVYAAICGHDLEKYIPRSRNPPSCFESRERYQRRIK